MSTISAPESSRARRLLCGILLFAVFALPVVFMTGKSMTGDEAAHLPAGYSYLKTHQVILNLEHPPLIKELCALPLLFLGAVMPADQATIEREAPQRIFEWRFGRAFFSGPNRDDLLFWGRLPAVVLSLALAALILRWATELWGALPAVLALFLYTFDPTITAHAQFVTTDVGFAFFATLFLYLLRAHVKTRSPGPLLAAGCVLGLALAAKFSGLMLLPLSALLLGAATLKGGNRDARQLARRLLAAGMALAVLVTLACGVVWATYWFPSDPFFYVKGLRSVQFETATEYPTLLMGTIRNGGFPTYFLIAWLVKTPLASLILLGLAVAVFFRERSRDWLEELFIIAPPLVFFFGYSKGAGQIGVRYLIPCFPFLFIFIARIATKSSSALRGMIAILLVWYVAAFAAISPDHLSYFNELAGGYQQGPYWLDDSNVDWGQGFIQLRDHLRAHPIGHYRLCTFPMNLAPKDYGLDGEPVWIEAILAPPDGPLILSAHCVARARANLAQLYGDAPPNWIAHVDPIAIVGHAFYVYDIRR